MRQKGMAASDIRREIAQMLQARMSGQIDQLLKYFAPGAITYCASSREGLLAPGVWQGADALRSVTRLTDENYQPLDYEILDILVDGQKAVVRWRGAWRRHATSKIYVIDAAHFLLWRNGLVIEMHEFFSRASEAIPHYTRAPSSRMLWMRASPGLDREEMERRARKLVAFSSSGPEVGVIEQYCSPDILCDFIGDRARIPYAGRHVGIDALLNIVRAVAVDFEQSNCEISEILIDEDRVAGRRSVEWRHRGTGCCGLVDLANFLRFEDGMIVELIEFRDTVSLLEMRGEWDSR